MKQTVLVLGASTKANRFSNKAIRLLRLYRHDVLAIGLKPGQVDDVLIQTDWEGIKNIDTITLYLNPQRQQALLEHIISVKPKRIIFNPGTENPELHALALEQGIRLTYDCTLVMLHNKTFDI